MTSGWTWHGLTASQRFWSKVKVGRADECWMWTGAVCGDPHYGAFRPASGRSMKAHRFAYEDRCGPIPAGKLLMHSCDNPLCVNPAHLTPGTDQQNAADCCAKGRQLRGSQKWSAKLHESQIPAIRALLRCGGDLKAIAQRFGVSSCTINDIKRGRTWRHVMHGGVS